MNLVLVMRPPLTDISGLPSCPTPMRRPVCWEATPVPSVRICEKLRPLNESSLTCAPVAIVPISPLAVCRAGGASVTVTDCSVDPTSRVILTVSAYRCRGAHRPASRS